MSNSIETVLVMILGMLPFIIFPLWVIAFRPSRYEQAQLEKMSVRKLAIPIAVLAVLGVSVACLLVFVAFNSPKLASSSPPISPTFVASPSVLQDSNSPAPAKPAP